jgi:hypothetical protein
MRCVYAWARSREWVEGGRWSVRRGMREVVRPFEGSQLLSKMRRDDCSDGGVSGDGGGDGKERGGGDEEGDR